MDPEEEAYLMQQQEVYQDEYGNEVMLNQMGQPQYDTSYAATNALVSQTSL